jgi:hypothetical protein
MCGRARIVLMTADGVGTTTIMRQTLVALDRACSIAIISRYDRLFNARARY